MRRSLGKLSHPAIGQTSRKALLLSSPFDFSTQAGNSGGGGRGRGRGSDFPKFSFVSPGPNKSEETIPDDETSFRAPLGHGRGKPLPPPPNIHQFTSSEPPSSGRGTVAGRGRGGGGPGGVPPPTRDQSGNQENSGLPSGIISALSGAGRGRPTSAPTYEASEKVKEVNRHIKPRQPVGPETRPVEPRPAESRPASPKLSTEEAVKKARSVLSKDDDGVRGGPREGSRMSERSDGGGRGLRGRGGDRGRGRGGGRGGRGGRMPNRDYDNDKDDEDDEDTELDKANEEKLKKYLGPEKMNILLQAFEEASASALPSPAEDAFVDAMHTNMMLECEPEYLMEFNSNPDIDEKPPIPLRDALQKMKPFLMAYENIETEKEWQECLEGTMKQVPLMKELVDAYSGPNKSTAKKQGEELERVAKTLPESAPQSVKRFTDRAVLSLQSNPGWGFNRKCQFMDKLVWEVQQSYK
ncbi:uncharacterized protein LOC143635824 isoform X2 [Bidens hawaiensis]|uniref:uncharacterized protein LOC143635824 isoform X2 n=1 Tax=Bidens hawaiensis TaxID=980011 RepID=UPI00404AA6EC